MMRKKPASEALHVLAKAALGVKIRMAAGVRAPAFAIEGVTEDIKVSIRNINLTGGGIHVGGQPPGLEPPAPPAP